MPNALERSWSDFYNFLFLCRFSPNPRGNNSPKHSKLSPRYDRAETKIEHERFLGRTCTSHYLSSQDRRLTSHVNRTRFPDSASKNDQRECSSGLRNQRYSIKTGWSVNFLTVILTVRSTWQIRMCPFKREIARARFLRQVHLTFISYFNCFLSTSHLSAPRAKPATATTNQQELAAAHAVIQQLQQQLQHTGPS